MPLLNSTFTGLTAIATLSPTMGWLLTIAIFFMVLVTIFLLSKNFRQFIYGAVISTIGLINYKLSRYIGSSTTNNNYTPIKWFGYIVGFIIISIIFGRLIQKLKFVKRLEDEFKEE